MNDIPNNQSPLFAEEVKTNMKMFLVTAKADNRNKSNPRVLYQYSEMLIPAPDLRCACDIAEELFKDFDYVEVNKVQQVDNNENKQQRSANT